MSGPISVATSPAGPTAEARGSVSDTFEERGAVVERRLDDGQARSRALLACMAERRPHEIRDGAVDVGAPR